MNSGVGDSKQRQDMRAAADQGRDDRARGFERRHEFRDGHMHSGVGDSSHRQDVRAGADQRRDDRAKGFEGRHEFRGGDSNHRNDAQQARSNRDEQRNTVRAGSDKDRTAMNDNKQNDSLRAKTR